MPDQEVIGKGADKPDVEKPNPQQGFQLSSMFRHPPKGVQWEQPKRAARIKRERREKPVVAED
jgi:hypothetical protein